MTAAKKSFYDHDLKPGKTMLLNGQKFRITTMTAELVNAELIAFPAWEQQWNRNELECELDNLPNEVF